GPADHAVLFTMHHIVSDGWSMGIFVRELAAFYQACLDNRPAALPPLPLQYADFAIWQREWLSGAVLAGEIAWWKERLAGAPARPELPTDGRRSLRMRPGGGQLSFRVDAFRTAGLDRLARRLGATPFMLLSAGLAALLERHGAQTDLVIGAALANRTHREIEG